jgi:hypothetical protein
VNALRAPGLGQIHAAEFSGADQTDPQRSFFMISFRQKMMEIHGIFLQGNGKLFSAPMGRREHDVQRSP